MKNNSNRERQNNLKFLEAEKKIIRTLENIETLNETEKKKIYDHLEDLYKTIEAYEKAMELTNFEKRDLYSCIDSYEKVLELSMAEKKDLVDALKKNQLHIKTAEEIEQERISRLKGGPDMILRTDTLVKDFKKLRAVDGVSIELKKGEVVGLLGPNGAGKTTIFYMIVGLEKPSEGKIYYNDKDITHTSVYKRARLGINYLPQESSIFRKLSVRENILAILELRKDLTNKEKKEKAEMLMDKLNIEYIANQKAYALSGGERRRVEIARSLASDPNFLLLDEPFAGIDPIAVQEIQQIIHRLVEETGVGILITDHNARETLRITDRAYIIVEGTIFTSGNSWDLVGREEVKEIYLGDNFTL